MNFQGETGDLVPMRDKDSIADYRFMPEPNLPRLRVYDDSDDLSSAATTLAPGQIINIDRIRETLPVMPWQLRNNLAKYGVRPVHVDALVHNVTLLEAFHAVMNDPDIDPSVNSNMVANILITGLANVLIKLASEYGGSIDNCVLPVALLRELCRRYAVGLINLSGIKTCLEECLGPNDGDGTRLSLETRPQVDTFIDARIPRFCNDPEVIFPLIDRVIDKHYDKISKLLRNRHKTGQVQRLLEKLRGEIEALHPDQPIPNRIVMEELRRRFELIKNDNS